MGKVLIIDDEKQILGLLSRIIGLEGYDVFQASTCRAGLKQLEQHTPEVILCDVCLPDGSGVEKMHIQKVLKYTNGNKTETSRLLGIGLTTLYRKIEEYGL